MLLDDRVSYKPFDFQQYMDEGWLKQCQVFWMHTEIPMQSDVKDWNENLTPDEKHLVENILMGFSQIETYVGEYWGNHVTSWFPKHEIKNMARAFSFFETIHAEAYSYLNETLGLTDFESFLQVPEVTKRFELLASPTQIYTHEDLKNSPEARRDVVRSLAVFSAFAEGVALYSSFAVLYSFGLRKLLTGVGTQMKYSVRDESLHSRMGIALFNHLCEEYPELRDEVGGDVKDAALLLYERELYFIDKMFEKGDLSNLKKADLKAFIAKRLQEKYEELGYKEQIVKWDDASADELNWFYELTGGVTKTDFLVKTAVDYSREGKEDWSLF